MIFRSIPKTNSGRAGSKTVYKPKSDTYTCTGDDAGSTIPIDATYVKVDAGGSARTGARFAGTGSAGQILYIENVGSEKITFHNTQGTSNAKIIASSDTFSAGIVQMFVSTGSLWHPIAVEMRGS